MLVRNDEDEIETGGFEIQKVIKDEVFIATRKLQLVNDPLSVPVN